MKTPVRTRLLSALLSLVMLVSLLPVSVFAAEPASGTWEKVTEAQEDWSGQYLIVYEKGSLIMDGSLSALDKEGNKVDVTITDGKIVGDYAKYAFTIAPMTGGWSVQSASGKYISGKSGSNKIITGSTPELNTITFADGNVKIVSNKTTLQYNAAATNGTRFRYYKSENQQPVALYKLSTVPARESGIVTDLTTLQNGDKVVVFNPANKKALSSVYNGFYNTGVDVELTGGKLTGYTNAELWTVNRTESGAYTFSTAEGKKLSMDTSYSSTPLDKAHTAWTLEQAATEGCYYIKNVGRGSYLEWFAEKNNWSSYGTIGSNEPLFAQQLYLVVAESPEPGQPEDPTAPLKNGDQVVIYNPANLKALSSEYTGFYNKGTDVTLTGGKLAGSYSYDGGYLHRCSLDGDGYAALLLGRYKSGSQGRLVTVDSQGRELASLDIDEEVMSLSAAGKYVAVLYQDHLTIYDKDLQEYAVLKDVSAAGTVLMRSDGSAVLTGASAASLYLP